MTLRPLALVAVLALVPLAAPARADEGHRALHRRAPHARHVHRRPAHSSAHVHVHVHGHCRYVAGHHTTRVRRVVVPGHHVERVAPAEYAVTWSSRHGAYVRVEVRPRRVIRTWVPRRVELRRRRVWVPGRWLCG